MGQTGLIVLYIIGVGAVITEMFIPGVIIGICGAACMIASIVLAYYDNHIILGRVLLICGFFLTPILLIIWYKVFSTKFSINADEKGFSSADESLKDLISAEGVAITSLHPSGIIMINGKRVDVVTSGSMIEKNTKVKVIEVEGNRVVVKPVSN